jgi:anti-sigma factor RsiW
MHTAYRESIQELIDGTIGGIRRAELERHLAECAECRSFLADMETIRQTAESLEPLEPPDRVWLQIAGRLRQEGRVQPPAARPASSPRYALMAIAAALVLVVGAAIVALVSQYRSTPPAPSTAAANTAAQPTGNAPNADIAVESVEAEFRLAEQHYQNAIAKLEQAARLDQAGRDANTLDAQTAAMLQKNLQVIDQAIAESREAVRSEPLSAAARDSLFDALRRKVALLQDTIALMNEMRKGNSAGAAQIVDGLNKS